MTPEERAKWCIEQADQIEADLPPRPEGLIPIAYCVADWYREMAFRISTQHGIGRA